MSVSGNPRFAFAARAGESLAGAQFKAIEVDGTVAANANTAAGILQNKPANGEDASIVYFGHAKAAVSGSVALGARLSVTTSGWLTSVVSGNGAQCARALAAANSGDVCEVLVNFINAHSTLGQV